MEDKLYYLAAENFVEWFDNYKNTVFADKYLRYFLYSSDYNLTYAILCTMANNEIKIRNALVEETIFNLLFKENKKVVQAAASCLLDCCSKTAKSSMEMIIDYPVFNKKECKYYNLIKGIYNLKNGGRV